MYPRYLLLLLSTCFLFSFQVFAQTPVYSPLFETRAVWFATLLGDGHWPQSALDPPNEQEEDLRARIRQARALGINTFIFQVTSRGDAMYRSTRLPWSPRLKGAGMDPGYDPLEVAIDEAHRLGMELHAWINVFRVGDTNTDSYFSDVSNPEHVTVAHPEWVQKHGNDSWLDPSLLEARDWLTANVIEIVDLYDIDAVHFDFIRYPDGGLQNDVINYLFDPRGFSFIEDWRRDNVTQFVRDISAAVFSVKSWVKVGATPIGNYQSNGLWPAFYGYSDVFQESRVWLKGLLCDYLAPQLYFSLGTAPEGSSTQPSPDFEWLIQDWEADSDGLPIFAGIAAYKPYDGYFPANDIPLQIDVSREAGAEGQVFFRFYHMMEYASLIATRYTSLAYPAPMTHRWEISTPSVPGGLEISLESADTIHLSWSAASGSDSDPLRGYAVFRREGDPPDVNHAEDLYDLIGPATEYYDTYSTSPLLPVYYQVVALSKLGMPSEGSQVVSTSSTALAITPDGPPVTFNIESIYPNPFYSRAEIQYTVEGPAFLSVYLFDLLGRQVEMIADGWHDRGRYRIDIDGGSLASGVFICEIRSGNTRITRKIVHAQ